MTIHPKSKQASTRADSLPEDYIKYYRENGFVKIPGIISKEEAARIGQRCREISDAAAEQKRSEGGTRKIFTQVVNNWTTDPVVKEAVLHPNITAIAKKLAGVALRLWHDHILVKPPHNHAPTEWHQDQPYWPHGNSSHPISCWLALVDVPADRGSMSFIAGAHHREDLPMQNLGDKRSLFSLAPDLEYEPKLTLPLRAGDCTFHHGRTPHMANDNATDEHRVALATIYIDDGTTYDGRHHIVTDPLKLKPGSRLEGDLFPLV
ncbi:MAG: phytanoyl-CoA dioxygenase family protein [Puniceicoccaceae bacterium]|nr:MAG: phytanoyl-CoA dioxygenase family protein [Puniceicoccaceae bacterium]